MRVVIEIDDDIVHRAVKGDENGNWSAMAEAVVEASRKFVLDIRGQSGIAKLRGKVHWDGNLEQSRLGRFRPE